MRGAALLCLALAAGASASLVLAKGTCGSGDDPGDCEALTDFANALGYKKWIKNTHWLESGKSVCEWDKITCNSHGRVTGIDMKNNNLVGSIPASIGKLTELQVFKISNSRPASYKGCGPAGTGNNLGNTSLPDSFWTLKSLVHTAWEYTCMGGTIPEAIGGLSNLQEMSWHGNLMRGSIPQVLDTLPGLSIVKLGRNPLTGTLPLFTKLSNLLSFNCNFCALSGTFPDMFGYMPHLSESFWDGNGFTGSLPASLGQAKNLTVMSFNINSFTGDIPASLCDVDTLKDCRIGSDTDLAPYQANYPWILPVKGNLYNCPVPKCATPDAICNRTKDPGKDQTASPVHCH